MSKILCVGDAHVTPEKTNERFNWLGQYIIESQPDTIVQLGDFLALESLSHWDKNKRLMMEGRRYKLDISAGVDALERLYGPIRRNYHLCRKSKKKTYWPNMVWCFGNHEEWVKKYIELHPELEDELDLIRDLRILDFDKTASIVPFGAWELIDGIAFTHAPIMANGRPVMGATAMPTTLSLFDYSVVFGHLHRLEFTCTNRHGRMALQQALSCGCFFEGSFDYCDIANNKFWRGVVMLTTNGDGSFDMETISLDRLRRTYG